MITTGSPAREGSAIERPAPGRSPDALSFREGCLDWSRPYVMGVLNVTPDSFSDGGKFESLEVALRHAERMIELGADIIDIGGESTRPGALEVSVAEECERVLPIIERLAGCGVPLSIDTTKAEVAASAVAAGAEIVNDVSGGRFDSQMIATVTGLECAYVCGHVPGSTLGQVHGHTSHSASAVLAELVTRLESLPEALRRRTIADPCIGFGKDLATNVALLRSGQLLREQSGCATLLGPSRKRCIGELSGCPIDERDAATLGACLASVATGANILRVHDVGMLVPALKVFRAVSA